VFQTSTKEKKNNNISRLNDYETIIMKPLLLILICFASLFSLPTYAAIPIENVEISTPILPIKTKKNKQKNTSKATKKSLKSFFSPPNKHKKQDGGESNLGLWFFLVTMSGTGALGYFFIELLGIVGIGWLMPLAVILGMIICTWMSYILLRRSKSFEKSNGYIMLWMFLFVGIWGAALALGGAAASIAWLQILGYILLSIFLFVLRII
jgi:hypothetical protein